MSNFIAHIGDGKCGSTSIQQSLFRSRGDLAQSGLVYATAPGINNHFSLVRLIGRQTRGNDAQLSEHAEKTVALLRSGLDASKVALISAEPFLMIPPQDLLRILRVVSPTARIDRLDLIAYVRAPHQMYLSFVQQILKASAYYPAPEFYERRLDEVLGGWNGFAEKDSLTVRLFERAHLSGGDVVSDFGHVLRRLTAIDTIALQPVFENVALTAEQLCVIQRLRATRLDHLDGKFHPLSDRVISLFHDLNTCRPIGHKLQLSELALSVVCANNRPVVEALNEMFPSLGMQMPGLPWPGTGDMPWQDKLGVEHILERCEEELVGHLTQIVPALSPDLERGMTGAQRRAMDYIIERFDFPADILNSHLHRYWTSCGCSVAAASLTTA